MQCILYMLPLKTSVIVVFPGKDTVKNQFYLFILIASFAVCGVVMFRPQTVDRVLGLLGLQDRTATTYIASEWDGLSANTTPNDDVQPVANVPIFGNIPANDTASFGDETDGFAVASAGASSIPPVPLFGGMSVEPFHQYGNQYGNTTLDEGVAVSGANSNANSNSYNGAEPDFSSFSAPPPVTNEMTIQLGGPAIPSPNPHTTPPAGYDFNGVAGFQQPPANQVVSDNAAGFANFTPLTQSAILQNGMSFNGNTPMANASVVMPDPHYDSGFGDYLIPMAASELDARIIPPPPSPAGSSPIPQGGTTNPQTAGIAQPVMSPEQYSSSENAVVPVQGVMPQTAAVPQFQTPQFETPQSIPPQSGPTMRETPLYVPPQGNSGPVSTSQPTPQPMTQPQPIAQPHPAQLPQQESVVIASATRHDLPVADMRVQYEQEVITEIETVFATEMLARVGSRHVIMTCDILAEVRERLGNSWAVQYRKAYEEYGYKPSVMEERNFMADGMQVIFEETLDSWILLLMLYVDMTLNQGDRTDEIKVLASKGFDMEIIPKMIEQYGVTNRYDLNEEFRRYGTTLDCKKENFIQQQLASEWVNEITKPQKSMPTFDDKIGYYELHKDEKYKNPGHVKWEELAVFFTECTSEEEARARIAELGNRVMQGEPFAEVAKQGSHGVSAYRGGERETIVDSLKTKSLEKAIFSLPIGKMSTIIQEDTGGNNAGFYIVRVLERQDTHYTPFDKVQDEIQKTIINERIAKEQQRVFAEIRKKYPVSKTNNLQAIIRMASEAERNRQIEDTSERHARLIARAERLEPAKKGNGDRQRGQTAITETSSPIAPTSLPSQEAIRIAAMTDGSRTQNTVSMSARETDAGVPSRRVDSQNVEPLKKKTFLQSINPFK